MASAAAVFVAALLGGALLGSGTVRGPAPVVAGELPARVLAAQADLDALRARIELVERGWHPDVAERRFTGELTYRAPEDLRLVLRDQTSYADGRWLPGDVSVVATAERWEAVGRSACPPATQPACQDPWPRRQIVTSREPFDEGHPPALDLVLPAESFLRSGAPALLGERQIGGRTAVGVRVSAAQVAPLLDGLRAVGDWRQVHPTDRVDLWLDQAVYTPLELLVHPAQGEERQLWAARRGYRDVPGQAIVELRLHDIEVNPAPSDPADPSVVDGAPRDDEQSAGFDTGFTDGPVGLPAPEWLPAGMQHYRSGTIATPKGPSVEVRTWTDGRAWVKVRATGGWTGERLFGGLGDAVHVLDLGDAGVGYADDGGDRIAIHTTHLDLVVTGSVPADVLQRIAAALPVVGEPVPATWPEAHTMAASQAGEALPGLLLPTATEGFGAPGISVREGIATSVYAGAGSRSFTLTQVPGGRLSPPVDPDTTGVEVRGTSARYAPGRGELEWVEDGSLLSLRSGTIGVGELLAIAESLRAP